MARCLGVPIGEITHVTRYKVWEDGKRRVLPHNPEVDDLIRMVCMAQWHDDVHHTNYRLQIEKLLERDYPQEQVESVLEVAYLALVQDPTNMNRFWKRLYWKEMKQLKTRRYGSYHSAIGQHHAELLHRLWLLLPHLRTPSHDCLESCP